jgi:hypothetical protein
MNYLKELELKVEQIKDKRLKEYYILQSVSVKVK